MTSQTTTTTTTTTTTYSQPTLPPLYFSNSMWSYQQQQEQEEERNGATDASSTTDNSSNEKTTPELPAELISKCLASYADWGDLAKLACVQKSWSNILIDAASNKFESKWELAQALLNGDCGLEANPERAMKLLKELSNIPIQEDNNKPCIESIIIEQQNENDVVDDDVSLSSSSTSTTTTNYDEKYHAQAMKLIANCYFTGTGVKEQNHDVGMAWLQASHEYGNDADAAHEMALAYEYGHYGIETDVVAAAKWFQKAAMSGHVEAMAELGLCYELGCGLEQSDELALDWYTKAANEGHVTAKFSVAEAFEEARGVPQSDEEACLWYYRAAVVGDEDSKIALRRLYDIARIVVPGVADILNE